MKVGHEGGERNTLLYRLEIGGPLAATWMEWFQADTITPAGENTILEVRVTDQAELYGRLRRIHDLNLRLISMTLAGPREVRVQDRVKDESIDNHNEFKGESQ